MKDPAFLFYPNDWSGGTMAMTRHVKGCYMDLLVALFNLGPLSLDEIKTVLGSDFGQTWPALQKKFVCKDGLYFNERLRFEKEKRSKYTQSRRENAKHMLGHMEDENRNEDINSNYEVFGELRKVLLTREEYEKLVEKLGEYNTNLMISELDTGIASKGYKYKSHYATILSWARRKVQDYQKSTVKKGKAIV